MSFEAKGAEEPAQHDTVVPVEQTPLPALAFFFLGETFAPPSSPPPLCRDDVGEAPGNMSVSLACLLLGDEEGDTCDGVAAAVPPLGLAEPVLFFCGDEDEAKGGVASSCCCC